jgi:FkbM family methyltransferase
MCICWPRVAKSYPAQAIQGLKISVARRRTERPFSLPCYDDLNIHLSAKVGSGTMILSRLKKIKISSIPTYSRWLFRLFSITEEPLTLFWHYLQGTSPTQIKLRSGHRLYCSGQPHDIITFFVIFIKCDYGRISPNSVVVDVGANIGFFTLFALINDASRVLCYEPNSQAFKTLEQNIIENNFQPKVTAIHKAVGAEDGETISIPIESSPYNQSVKLVAERDDSLFETVATVSLNEQISEHNIEHVDLLKMDCEGAEFDIFPSLTETTIRKIKEIRMEVHGDANGLIKSLKANPFRASLREHSGLWLIRN